MSDFGTRQGVNRMFFTIRKGTDAKGRPCAVFANKVPKGTPGAKQAFKNDGAAVIDKNGNEIWHLHYDYLKGRIVDLQPKEMDMKGKTRHFLDIVIQGTANTMVVSIERGDRYWVDFAMRAPNIKADQPVELIPYSITDEKTKRTNQMLMVKQGGANVPRRWTKENNWGNDAEGNGGLPSGKRVTNPVDGELVWTFLERDNYLEKGALTLLSMNVTQAVEANPPAGGPATAPAEQRPVENQAEVYGGPTATTVVDSDPFDGGAHMEDDSDLPF